MKTKSIITVTGAEIGNIMFELDEACAALRLTEDEHKFAVDSIVAAWKAQLSAKKVK
jgi:SLT domain-containing protein